MAGILSGLSTFGRHVGVGSSYGAFLAPLGHIAARLHAIGAQARAPHGPWSPFLLVCAHAGLKTGEDGPTHADPQPLQLLQENFPRGTMVTLTPWDPAEIWTLLAAAFRRRPAVIAPFVTRPNETVLDRAALGLAPVEAAATGVYLLRKPTGRATRHGRAAGERRRLRLPRAGAAAPREGRDRPARLLRGERRAVRPAAGGGAEAPLPGGARSRGGGHHRLHAADAVPLGRLRSRPGALASPVQEGALPRQRPGAGGPGRGRPRRRRARRRRSRAYVEARRTAAVAR